MTPEQTALPIPAAAAPGPAPARQAKTSRPAGTPRSGDAIVDAARPLFEGLANLPLEERVSALNQLRELLHEQSPFNGEPVDLVLWEKAEDVEGNAYNPNVVAPRQMELLQHSITADGFTQPIVAWRPPTRADDAGPAAPIEVVDGFHRHLIGKHTAPVNERLHGYLPITTINRGREAHEDRQAATVRHNAARGVHTIDGLSDMVLQLLRTGKTYAWFEKELGMQPDEVTRLAQVHGLAEMFTDHEFTEAWEAATGDPFATGPDAPTAG
ncbi:ParB N-terminal domain-containing protein [Streptomyces sp. NPDC056056]|uniref:ParB N-terminal domain-containing protein n=1 Tax=Streptomyces sp. NPDC056056 TaxID=3345698 RepID=UPI0035D83636